MIVVFFILSLSNLGETTCFASEPMVSEAIPISDEEYFENWKEENARNANTRKKRRENLEAKKKQYCTGGTDWKKVSESFYWQGATVAASGFITYFIPSVVSGISQFLTQTVQRIAGRPGAANRNRRQPPGGQLADALSPLVLSLGAMVSTGVTNFINIYKDASLDEVSGLKYVYPDLKEESKSLVQSLPQDVQDNLQLIDDKLESMFSSNTDKNTDKKSASDYLRRREEVLLALPTQTLNVAHYNRTGDPRIRKIIDDQVQQLVEDYPEEQREALSLLVQAIRDNSITRVGNQVQAYLYGEAGTGKTTFVIRLAAILGLPVCVVNFSNPNLFDLLGSEYFDRDYSQSDSEVLGKIVSCFIDSGYLNPIFLFEEAGEYLSDSTPAANGMDFGAYNRQFLQGQFKKLFDPSIQSFPHRGLGVHINTWRGTFLLSSNYTLDNAALLSRMTQIYFKKLSRREKEMAAFRSFTANEEELVDLVASDSDADRIRETVRSYLAFIIDEDEKLNPGGRIVQSVVTDFFGQLRLFLLQEQKDGIHRLDDEEKLKRVILKSFERRRKLEAETKKEVVVNVVQ